MDQENKMKEKFLNLVEMHQGIIHKILSIYTYNVEDREDLLQEIMLQLWKSFPGFLEKAAFSTWMYKVALNTALLHKRKKMKEKYTVDALIESRAQQIGLSKDDTTISLYMAIDQLGPIDKAIALLYLEQKSYQEIENILGMKKNNIGVRISRIKDKLKKIFEYEQQL
jgi:RNA polymerase sigma-70 factor (ECF subfamily)